MLRKKKKKKIPAYERVKRQLRFLFFFSFFCDHMMGLSRNAKDVFIEEKKGSLIIDFYANMQ